MPITMYEIAIPSFTKHLDALDAILDKAAAYAEAKKIDPEALLWARLYPDMYPFKKQVQSACDFAKLSVGRLAGLTPPVHDDSEKTFADLKRRIAETLAVLAQAKPEPMEAAADPRDHHQGRPARADVHGRGVSIALRPAELLFPCRDRLRHPAPQRAGDRQARFHEAAVAGAAVGRRLGKSGAA